MGSKSVISIVLSPDLTRVDDDVFEPLALGIICVGLVTLPGFREGPDCCGSAS